MNTTFHSKNEEKQKAMSFIKVPNSLILNTKEQNVSCLTFAIYVGLKLGSINDFYKKRIDVLEDTLYFSKKVIKTHIKKLEELGYIKCRFENFPQSKPMEIDIVKCENKYTTLDRGTIYKIIKITQNVSMDIYKKPKNSEEETQLELDNTTNEESKKIKKTIKKTLETNLLDKALRYYYLLEMHYNCKYDMSYPTYDYIAKYGAIAKSNISFLNQIFVENKLMFIIKGNLYKTETGIKKENNKYKLHSSKQKFKYVTKGWTKYK